MLILRDYQQSGINEIRETMRTGHKRVVYVLPTGGGKSLVVGSICKGVIDRNKRGLVMAHRQELLDQLSGALETCDVPHAMIRPGMKKLPRSSMLIGSVQTVANRLDKMPAPDFVLVDEVHHAVCPTYARILQSFPEAYVIGVTASPARTDGRGLGEYFTGMRIGPSVAELTEQGYLVPAEVWGTPIMPDLSRVKTRMGDYATADLESAMDKPKITGDAVQHYRRIAHNKAALVFCVSIKHAHAVAADFRAAGYNFLALDGTMNYQIRREALEDLRKGDIHGICSAEIIGEGVDIPRVECVILLRPTQSLIVALQQIGRGLRPYSGKDKCIILDHAGVVNQHGLPDAPREWSLDGVPPKKKGEKVASVRVCVRCFAAHKPAPKCPMCGYEYTSEGRTIDEVAGELVKVIDPKSLTADDVMGSPSREKEYAYLVHLGRMRGYKDPAGWAFIIMRAREAKRRTKAAGKKVVNG